MTNGTLPLRPGAEGDAVADLQRRLRATGYAPGDDVAGCFGAGTESAVRRFQEARGLRTDGVCGDDTWTSLVEAGHRLGDRLLSHRAPMLRGDDIADLQRLLGGLGFDAGRVDGLFGPATAAAVVEFQRNVGLPTDGVCGPDTVTALRRFADKDAVAVSTVAHLRETDAMRHGPRGLEDRRVVIGESGEAGSVADGLGRALRGAGAVVSVVHHPDDHDKAAAANAFAADLYLGIIVRPEPCVVVSYYAREGFESIGGRHLATLVAEALPPAMGADPVEALGMRLPVLRETRMPAVVLELGPPAVVVERLGSITAELAGAVRRWATEPLE